MRRPAAHRGGGGGGLGIRVAVAVLVCCVLVGRATASCADGIKSGDETDIDCGGSCSPCGTGKHCAAAADCTSFVCSSSTCAAATCSDHIRNGDETDVDCGGSCGPCADNSACRTGADCTSKVCSVSKCAAPSCSDRIRNGQESSTDCGGTCAGCADGLACATDSDCWGGRCATSKCAANLAKPVWQQSSYSFVVLASAAAGTQLGTVAATDSDSGLSGQVKYSILSGNTGGLLAVDPTSGLVTLAHDLSGLEYLSALVLQVLASDNGLPSKNATVLVAIKVLRYDMSIPSDIMNEPVFGGRTTSVPIYITISPGVSSGLQLLITSADPSLLSVTGVQAAATPALLLTSSCGVWPNFPFPGSVTLVTGGILVKLCDVVNADTSSAMLLISFFAQSRATTPADSPMLTVQMTTTEMRQGNAAVTSSVKLPAATIVSFQPTVLAMPAAVTGDTTRVNITVNVKCAGALADTFLLDYMELVYILPTGWLSQSIPRSVSEWDPTLRTMHNTPLSNPLLRFNTSLVPQLSAFRGVQQVDAVRLLFQNVRLNQNLHMDLQFIVPSGKSPQDVPVSIALNGSGMRSMVAMDTLYSMELNAGAVSTLTIACDNVNTCNNHGLCGVRGRTAYCTCAEGFFGDRCEKDSSVCTAYQAGVSSTIDVPIIESGPENYASLYFSVLIAVLIYRILLTCKNEQFALPASAPNSVAEAQLESNWRNFVLFFFFCSESLLAAAPAFAPITWPTELPLDLVLGLWTLESIRSFYGLCVIVGVSILLVLACIVFLRGLVPAPNPNVTESTFNLGALLNTAGKARPTLRIVHTDYWWNAKPGGMYTVGAAILAFASTWGCMPILFAFAQSWSCSFPFVDGPSATCPTAAGLPTCWSIAHIIAAVVSGICLVAFVPIAAVGFVQACRQQGSEYPQTLSRPLPPDQQLQLQPAAWFIQLIVASKLGSVWARTVLGPFQCTIACAIGNTVVAVAATVRSRPISLLRLRTFVRLTYSCAAVISWIMVLCYELDHYAPAFIRHWIPPAALLVCLLAFIVTQAVSCRRYKLPLLAPRLGAMSPSGLAWTNSFRQLQKSDDDSDGSSDAKGSVEAKHDASSLPRTTSGGKLFHVSSRMPSFGSLRAKGVVPASTTKPVVTEDDGPASPALRRIVAAAQSRRNLTAQSTASAATNDMSDLF